MVAESMTDPNPVVTVDPAMPPDLAADRLPFEMHAGINALDELAKHTAELPDLLGLLTLTREVKQALSMVEDELQNTIGDRLPGYRMTVEGVGQVERHTRSKYRNWRHQDLLRLVLDSRMVDPETGEVESQIDAIKAVYGSKDKKTGEQYMPGYQASKTELKRRAIHPEEFCEVDERPGWTVRIR